MRKFSKNRCIKISYVDLFLYITLLFPILTILVDNGIANKLLFAFLISGYCMLILKQGFSKRTVINILILIFNYVFTLYFTQFPMTNSNLLFYYPFTVLYLQLATDYSKSFIVFFKKNINIIKYVVFIWNLLVGISIFIPSSYYVRVGDGKYFGSYVGKGYRVEPATIFILSLILILMVYERKKWYFIYSIIPLYCIFMGCSRTYLVVGLCILAIQWFVFVGEKKIFYVSMVPITAIIIIIIFNSSIGSKIMYTLEASNVLDFMAQLTSSRSNFWPVLIKGWVEQPIINKIFGSGIEFSINKIGIWAHNDFLEICLSFGLTGLIQYILLIKTINLKYFNFDKNISKIVKLLVVMGWFFNAFFSMFYTYFCALLSYPFILVAVHILHINADEDLL